MYSQAIAAYTKTIHLAPDIADPYYYVGLLYQYVENDTEKSGEMLKKYLSLAPAGKHAAKARRIMEMIR
jgi:tetratricopeptide (TPR) repeat protein